MAVIMHIGVGKCGSSSLQGFLAANRVLHSRQNTTYKYGATLRSGKILSGRRLFLYKSLLNKEYLASCSFGAIAKDETALLSFKRNLCKTSGNKNLVLSFEGWANEAEIFRKYDVFTEPGLKVDAAMYVRPPVSWLNSGWWQWGAWTGATFEQWFEKNLPRCNWIDRVKAWEALPFVNRVLVRPLPANIVEDFCDLLDVDYCRYSGQNHNVNKSLPNEVLRLFQHNQQLWPNAHASEIDFILSRHLSLSGTPDWVLSPEQVERVISSTRESNTQLMQRMPEKLAREMASDSRWWDAASYQDEIVKPSGPLPENEISYNGLSVELINRIVELDVEYLTPRGLIMPAARWIKSFSKKLREFLG